MVEEEAYDDLNLGLFKIAADPAHSDSLHRLLGCFCHQCRNLLNSMKLSLYLAKRGQLCTAPADWVDLESRYRALEQVFDRLQSICRPIVLTPMRGSLALLFDDRRESWIAEMAARDRALTLVAPREPAVGDFDPVRLREGLDAFVGYRAEFGTQGMPARMSWSAENGVFRLDWKEGGPKTDASRAVGLRGSSTLALPLLARIIAAHRGTIDLNLREGLQLKIRWPLDLRPA